MYICTALPRCALHRHAYASCRHSLERRMQKRMLLCERDGEPARGR